MLTLKLITEETVPEANFVSCPPESWDNIRPDTFRSTVYNSDQMVSSCFSIHVPIYQSNLITGNSILQCAMSQRTKAQVQRRAKQKGAQLCPVAKP